MVAQLHYLTYLTLLSSLHAHAADEPSCALAEQSAEGQALLQSTSQRNAISLVETSNQKATISKAPPSTSNASTQFLIPKGSYPFLGPMMLLDDASLATVTGTRCHLEMETYLRHVVKELSMEVCDEVGFLQLVPMYANPQVGEVKYARLLRHLLAAKEAKPCPMVALRGQCTALAALDPAKCPTNAADPILASAVHRRRACKLQIQHDSGPSDHCQLPEGAAWCEVRLKGMQPYWMAVYDWSEKSDWVSRNICTAGFWDNYDISDYGSPGQMIDIGGNIGYFTVALASAGWNVTVFEPMAPNQALLNLTLCRNPMLASRVQLIPFGLGAADQECDMVAPEHNMGDGSVMCGDEAAGLSKAAFSKFNVVKIGHFSIRRLDQMLLQQGIGKVDFVKIDVEGYESQVLEGAGDFLTKHRPRLFKLEVWNNSFGFNGPHFLERYNAAGYRFFQDSKCTLPVDAKQFVHDKGLWEGFACI